MLFDPLSREEVISVIERTGKASRIPVALHFWIDANSFGDRQKEVLAILSRYPEDIQVIGARQPEAYSAPEDDPSYRWVNYDPPAKQDISRGLDANDIIPDWSLLDGILSDFPNPNYQGMFPAIPDPDGRYRLGLWWFCFFERHWYLRGMENALVDYYTDPESVHKLFSALTDFYKVVIRRLRNEANCDGFFMSDDIGTQTCPFFSQQIFEEFYKPYYRELIQTAHSEGMHFWLHTCGNVQMFLPSFVEIGLDVIHPIQKYTMDESIVARDYGKDICIWSGFDVQQTIPWGSPDDVRKEVRHLFDTFQRPEGGLMFTAGNGVKGDCTIESLEALFDEAFNYGKAICAGLEVT